MQFYIHVSVALVLLAWTSFEQASAQWEENIEMLAASNTYCIAIYLCKDDF